MEEKKTWLERVLAWIQEKRPRDWRIVSGFYTITLSWVLLANHSNEFWYNLIKTEFPTLYHYARVGLFVLLAVGIVLLGWGIIAKLTAKKQ